MDLYFADRLEVSLNVLNACLQCSAQSNTQLFQKKDRGSSANRKTQQDLQVPEGEVLNGLSEGVLGSSTI